MNCRWRKFLVWLMLLALPAQGMAGLGMQHCAPQRAPAHAHAMSDGTGVRVQHRHLQQHVAGPADPLGVVEEGAPVEVLGAHDAAGAAIGANDGLQAHVHDLSTASSDHTCSACAACCTSAALPASKPAVAAPGPGSPPRAEPETSSCSFIDSGLERPPRLPLA